MIKTKLNIGCGSDKPKDFINLDISAALNPDVVGDIEEKFPFKDNSFDEIRAWRILEHVNPHKFRFVLNEISRVAKEGCLFDIIVPFDNIFGRSDFDHKRAFTWSSFWALEQPLLKNSPEVKLRLMRVSGIPSRMHRAFFSLFPNLHPAEIHLIYKIKKPK